MLFFTNTLAGSGRKFFFFSSAGRIDPVIQDTRIDELFVSNDGVKSPNIYHGVGHIMEYGGLPGPHISVSTSEGGSENRSLSLLRES